ncbi:MAG: hypothetical protein ABSC06_19605 [Rhodopila sp.]
MARVEPRIGDHLATPAQNLWLRHLHQERGGQSFADTDDAEQQVAPAAQLSILLDRLVNARSTASSWWVKCSIVAAANWVAVLRRRVRRPNLRFDAQGAGTPPGQAARHPRRPPAAAQLARGKPDPLRAGSRCRQAEPATETSPGDEPPIVWTPQDIVAADAFLERERIEKENEGLDIANTEGILPGGGMILPENPTPQQKAYMGRRLALMYKREYEENLRQDIKQYPKIRGIRPGDLIP